VNEDRAMLVGAYVLDALDEIEREEFERQLAEFDELRNEVTELADTAVLLGLAVEPVTPSASLRDSIMARVATTPQLPRESAPVAGLQPVPSSDDEVPAQLGAVDHPRWYRRPVVILTSAAAAILLIAGAIFGSGLGVQAIQMKQQADALAAINAAPDSQHAAASISTGGTATLVWSDRLGRSAFIANGLAQLPGSKTYELWYIDSAGKPTAAGLFEPTGARTWRVLDGSMVAGDVVGVTVEPAGGSKAPTTKPIVAIPSA
jgi:anti-sigma-K factor RskA